MSSIHNTESVTVRRLVTDLVLDEAYEWLCVQRKERGHNNSVWDLRYTWHELKPQLQNELLSGVYRLSPMQSYTINKERISVWVAKDSLVLKALTILLKPLVAPQILPHCTHIKNGGGIHAAIKTVASHKSHYQYILKSDVFHYYESIGHQVLLAQLGALITCPVLFDLSAQYCQRLEIRDGNYYHFKKGIPKGCPLSPLIGALYLKPLDDEMHTLGCYVRFMDDWVIMVKTKYQLRKIIKLTHAVLKSLKVTMHPDKTFFGWIKKGFDFLGVHFAQIPEIAPIAFEKHRATVAQRYAQGASESCIGNYVARWTSWCAGVLEAASGTPASRKRAWFKKYGF